MHVGKLRNAVDGTEAAMLIREINPNQRIIFVTAYAKLADDILYEIPNNVEVLIKPADLDTLLEAIESKETIPILMVIRPSRCQHDRQVTLGLSPNGVRDTF